MSIKGASSWFRLDREGKGDTLQFTAPYNPETTGAHCVG